MNWGLAILILMIVLGCAFMIWVIAAARKECVARGWN